MGPGRKPLLVILLSALLPALLALSPAWAARGEGKARKDFKPKDWIGRPGGDLVAVMGPPEKERETKKGTVLVWRRYPIGVATTPDTRVVGRTYGPEADVDPPPIPGDPTAEGMQVIECTARVSRAGVITRISMPGPCQVPAPSPAAEDEPEEREKPELPRGEQPGPR